MSIYSGNTNTKKNKINCLFFFAVSYFLPLVPVEQKGVVELMLLQDEEEVQVVLPLPLVLAQVVVVTL